MSLDEAQLRALVRAVVKEVVAGQEEAPPEERPIWSRGPRHRPLPEPRRPEAIERLKATTPARIITGRTGTRYLTPSYLGLRADHAIALDAVESELDEAFAAQQGWVFLRSQADTHQTFLLQPDLGRRLDEPSKAVLAAKATRNVDVQLIAGDGLSAVAVREHGPVLMRALADAHRAQGFTVGEPLFVKFARIGVQDEIGVLTAAKSTVIIVGERPGLGTGDSISIYTAFGPRLGQDNAEKDCISNVRPQGFAAPKAAARCAALMKQCFVAGGGGVKLIGGDALFRPHVSHH
jgi:ethanolamine ammonia-lyase small subunit